MVSFHWEGPFFSDNNPNIDQVLHEQLGKNNKNADPKGDKNELLCSLSTTFLLSVIQTHCQKAGKFQRQLPLTLTFGEKESWQFSYFFFKAGVRSSKFHYIHNRAGTWEGLFSVHLRWVIHLSLILAGRNQISAGCIYGRLEGGGRSRLKAPKILHPLAPPSICHWCNPHHFT